MPTNRPNIIFFFTDDQRFDMLSGLRHPTVRTPHLDSLMKRGVTFTEAHIPGGLDAAICMPSRAMLHTGRTLFHLHDKGRSVPSSHHLMGEELKKAGYRCFGSGKWHNGPQAFNRSFDAGTDIFFGGMNDHWNVPCFDYDPTGAYADVIRVTDNWFYSNKTWTFPGNKTTPGKHSSELIADAGIRFLREKSDDAPHFMYLSFLAPHDPRTMPEEYRRMYDPEAIELPGNFMQEHPFDFGINQVRDKLLSPRPLREADIRRHIAEYYAMITHLDAQIGRVIAEVEARGEIDDTLFIMAGDNGLAVGQHGLLGKQNSYEHSIRVPLILAGPGIVADARCDKFVYLLDIFPTLCDYLEIATPESVDGVSFRDRLGGSAGDSPRGGRDEIYFAYTELIRTIKDRQFKLIEYQRDGVRRTQLFDYRRDPEERRNLFGLREHDERVAGMRERLRQTAVAWDDEDEEMGRTFWTGFSSGGGSLNG